MTVLRKAILWTVLAAIGLLAALSIIGAFLGAERAKGLFNSVPLVAYWFLLGLLLLAGFIFFKRLLRSPAALAMHLGSLLVLGGAMWGSGQAHEIRKACFGGTKVPSGSMVIYEGRSENRILDRQSERPIAELPFHLHLKDFSIDYYPPKETTWGLFSVTPVLDAEGDRVAQQQAPVPWNLGQDLTIPHTRIVLRVLQYLPNASLVWEEGQEPIVEVTAADGRKVVLPARPGQEAEIKDPPLKVRVTRTFLNLIVQGAGENRTVTDAPGEGSNPAVAVELTKPGGQPLKRYLFALMAAHGQADDGLSLRYVLPKPAGARPDPSSKVPAMEVRVTLDSRERRAWFLPQEGQPWTRLALVPLLVGKSEEEMPDDTGPALFLVPPHLDIRAYKSDIVVEGISQGEVARQIIEVNHPLYYGGYHFYQVSYDERDEQYTVLEAVSDSGLTAVYAGFALLAAAAFGRFWGRPAWRVLCGAA